MNRGSDVTAPFRAMLCWAVAVAAAALAVGSDPASLTFLVLAVGALYLVFPPSGFFPRSLLILSALLLLLAATAFLPAAVLPHGFRAPFLDRGFVLPDTLSPQPWLSLEDFTLLFASLLWAWMCLEAGLSAEQRDFLTVSYLIALGLLALPSILQGTSFLESLPSQLQNAGRFANRNQTGDLLVIGGIVSFDRGLGKLSRHKEAAIFWLALAVVFLAAIIKNESRAALILFGLGILISCCFLPAARRHRALLWPALYGVALVGALFFFFSGAALRGRFALFLSSGQEGRLPIYRDAFSFVGHHPLFGVGLGNFEGVFNAQRVHSIHMFYRALHPESDWLWASSEMGLGAVVILALMVFLTFRTYLLKTPFPRFTQTSITVAVLFLIHSLFDVGGHRMGTMWNCLFVVGLGAFRTSSPSDWKIPQVCLRAAGLLAVGVALLRLQSMSLQPWMPTRASIAKVEETAAPPLAVTTQTSLIDRAIQWAPLDWYPHYRHGLLQLQAGAPDLANVDFNRALFLDQATPLLPTAIAEASRHGDFPEALLAWAALLQRAGDDRESLFDSFFLAPGLSADQCWQLSTLAGNDPALNMVSLVHQDASDFDELRQIFLLNNSNLAGISPGLARRFFDHWFEVGDAAELVHDWPLHPEWQAPGWRAYARALAKLGRYEDAVAIGFQFLPKPPMPAFPPPPDVAEASRLFYANPQDSITGLTLYFAQAAAGADGDALETLKKVAALPGRPAYIQYLLAKNLADADEEPDGWQALAPLFDPR